MNNCISCKEELKAKLASIPSEWREVIATAICENKQTVTCEDLTDCETLTSLSAFSVVGDNVCISYKDENGVTVQRCFDTSAFVAALANGDYGDITVSGAGDVWTIDNDTVTFAKMQDVSTNILLGRDTAGTGNVEEITLGTGLSMSGGGVLNVGNTQRFGVAGEDSAATQHRNFSGADMYDVKLSNTQLIVTGTNGAGEIVKSYWENQMFFNSRLAAFRAGVGLTGQWDNGSVGAYSTAFGANNTANANYTMSWGAANFSTGILSTTWGSDAVASHNSSTAFGQACSAIEFGATAWGYETIAAGQYSTAFGIGVELDAWAGTAIGHYNDNTLSTPPGSTAFDVLNRAFQIGIGTSDIARANALTVLFNGNSGFGQLIPTAVIHLKAGTATAGTSPLKFTSGTLLGTPEVGSVEFLTDKWYGTITTGAARKTFAFLESPTFTGTVTIPTPFTLGATSVTTVGTKLNYLTNATGTTGTDTTNIVFSTSPTLLTPTIVDLIGSNIYPAVNSVTAIQINRADGTTNVVNVDTTNSRVGIGTIAPDSLLHLSGGSTSAAPLKFTTGANLTVAQAGAMEYNGVNLFFSPGGTRESVLTSATANAVSPTAPDRTITVVIDGTTYYIHAKTTND